MNVRGGLSKKKQLLSILPWEHYTVSRENSRRQQRLLSCIAEAQSAGMRFAPLSHIDAFVQRRQPCCILKHDVHALRLGRLEKFARTEARMGVFGTYFFMVPDHPLTARAYDRRRQLKAMRIVQSLGHELGLHVDPFFVVDHFESDLKSYLEQTLNVFAEEKLVVRVGNIHGNSAYKGLDNHGFGTSHDFFEEIARQPDYPQLKDLPEPTAAAIRANRMCLADIGFDYWGDVPVWTRRYKYVFTNYVSDNQLGKRNVLRCRLDEHCMAQYKLADRQLPAGSNASTPARELVAIRPQPAGKCFTSRVVDWEFWSEHTLRQFKALSDSPCLLLLHPQFYV